MLSIIIVVSVLFILSLFLVANAAERSGYDRGVKKATALRSGDRAKALMAVLLTVVRDGLEMKEAVLSSPLSYRPATLYGQLFGMHKAAMVIFWDLRNETQNEEIIYSAEQAVRSLSKEVDEALVSMTK